MLNNKYIYDKIKSYIDVIIVVLTLILSVKKGGFYASDSYFYINSIVVIFFVYLLNNIIFKFSGDFNSYIKKIKCDFSNNKVKYISILLSFLLIIAYALPIIFNTYINYNDSINEMLRYFAMFSIIYIVANSNNKKTYIILIVLIGILQVIFGIDGIANRYLQSFLKTYNSGYLSKDLDRLSGTIQYANLTGLIFTISSIIVIKYLNKYINMIKEKDMVLKYSFNKFKYTVFNVCLMLFTICTILTKSKMILALYLVSLLIIFVRENSLLKFNIISVLILSFMGATNIEELIYIDLNNIYFTVICYIVLCIMISNIYIKYIVLNKPLHKYLIKKIEFIKTKIPLKNNMENNKLIIGKSCIKLLKVMFNLLVIGIAIYFLTLFTTSLNIKEESNYTQIERTYYNLSDENIFEIAFGLEENSSIYIDVIAKTNTSEDIRLETHIVEESNNVDSCKITFDNNDYKCITLKFYNIEGNVEIKEILLNEDVQVIEYLLLPTDLMFRIVDVVNLNSTSLTDRVQYNKDAIKIWETSKIIGLGGEAFKYEYKYVQTVDYNSTEVHNIYLQTLVESGMIGFIILIILIIFILKQKTDKYIKLAFIIFIVHSIFDLNFSYLIGIIIFGILIGILINKEGESS